VNFGHSGVWGVSGINLAWPNQDRFEALAAGLFLGLALAQELVEVGWGH